MSFKDNKENINKNGRPKGSLNKSTAETKELLQTIISNEIYKLSEMLEKLEPLDRVNAVAKLLPYILPKQNEVKAEITTDIGRKMCDLSKLSDATLDELIKAYE